jgi:hypothetical protein
MRAAVHSLSAHLRHYDLNKDYDRLRSNLSIEDIEIIKTFNISAQNMPTRGVLFVTWTYPSYEKYDYRLSGFEQFISALEERLNRLSSKYLRVS